MTRIDRNELRSLLLGESGTPARSPRAPNCAAQSAEAAAAGTSPPADSPDPVAPTSAPAHPAAAAFASTPSPSTSQPNPAFTNLHAELGKVMPTLWRRACEGDPARGTPRERLLALIRWWAGKHEYPYFERVAVHADGARRLDVVLHSGAVRLAVEVDARFSAASLAKLQAAHRAGYVVLVVWTTPTSSREQARALRHKVSASLAVRNLHWLPMLHAQWGWI